MSENVLIAIILSTAYLIPFVGAWLLARRAIRRAVTGGKWAEKMIEIAMKGGRQ
jgi:hypothetical protein